MNKTSRNKINFFNIAIISVIAIFFALDQYLKNLAMSLPIDESWSIIPNFLNFSFSKNPYIAFSLQINSKIITPLIIFILISLAITIVYFIYKNRKLNLQTILLITIFIGAISNLIDRISYGYVIDYLSLANFSVFNIADAMISVGTISYIYTSLIKK